MRYAGTFPGVIVPFSRHEICQRVNTQAFPLFEVGPGSYKGGRKIRGTALIPYPLSTHFSPSPCLLLSSQLPLLSNTRSSKSIPWFTTTLSPTPATKPPSLLPLEGLARLRGSPSRWQISRGGGTTPVPPGHVPHLRSTLRLVTFPRSHTSPHRLMLAPSSEQNPPWPAFRGYHEYSFAHATMGHRLPTILGKAIDDVIRTLNEQSSEEEVTDLVRCIERMEGLMTDLSGNANLRYILDGQCFPSPFIISTPSKLIFCCRRRSRRCLVEQGNCQVLPRYEYMETALRFDPDIGGDNRKDVHERPLARGRSL